VFCCLLLKQKDKLPHSQKFSIIGVNADLRSSSA